MWENFLNGGNNNSNPFNMDNLQKLAQLQQFNQINSYNIVNQDKYNELQKQLQNLTSDEKSYLLSDETFMVANNTYEQSLFTFIANQFRGQYNNTPEGQKFLADLENALNSSLKKVKDTIEQEKNEMRQLKELIKNNPEILKNLNKNE